MGVIEAEPVMLTLGHTINMALPKMVRYKLVRATSNDVVVMLTKVIVCPLFSFYCKVM